MSKIITTKKMKQILQSYGYEPNEVHYNMFGEFAWYPKNEPIDLNLPKKILTLDELKVIKTETELLKVIKNKLNGK